MTVKNDGIGLSAAYFLGCNTRVNGRRSISRNLPRLAKRIHSNVFFGLHQTDSRLEDCYAALRAAKRACDSHEVASLKAKRRRLHTQLEAYADEAFEPSDPYRYFYDLGVAMGLLHPPSLCRLQESPKPVLERAGAIPSEYLTGMPLLRELHALESDSKNIGDLMQTAVYNFLQEYLLLDEEGIRAHLRIDEVPEETDPQSWKLQCVFDEFRFLLLSDLLSGLPGAGCNPDRNDRDEFVFREYRRGTRNAEIVAKVNDNPEWMPITNEGHVRKIACKYAEQNGLPRPLPRRGGRPRKN